jgi:glycerol-3-phosphate dehydrogenase (NAD(P)+)
MIGVLGSGAFGTALAVALAREGREVRLWGRDPDAMDWTRQSRQVSRLPGVALPENVSVTSEIRDMAHAKALLLAVPMQALNGFLGDNAPLLNGLPLIGCAKGVDLTRLEGSSALMALHCPASPRAVLTGPSFAADIARGLPTALTLASADLAGEHLQHLLATPVLRLYLSSDPVGAELGGALKNVIAIAAGVVMGAGLGESARAALVTRGYAEMLRLAVTLGARAETLAGLSGLGDLVLTCTSLQSRNLRFGMALGGGPAFDPGQTVEGVATARAVTELAHRRGVEMPISAMVAALVSGKLPLEQAVQSLLSRPLKQE